MSDPPHVDELEERVDDLESTVRLLTMGFVLAVCGLPISIVIPGLNYVLVPMVLFALAMVVLGLLL